jgi:release factor glutamine methyltransferase
VTIREALRSAAERLELHRVSNARITAELLLAHILSVEREYLYSHDDRVLHNAELQALEDLLYDRISGTPLQYLVGRQEFYGRYFRVTPAVLIPRPETEYIIESVLETTQKKAAIRTPRILDVGTGSVCIAITLALEMPNARVFATDISGDALQVAAFNATKLHANVGFACIDLMDAIATKLHFIVSNPPYVRRDDLNRLQREVREHEPHVALFSPDDELTIYRRLIHGAQELLMPGGNLVVEVGFGMAEAVIALFNTRWRTLPAKTDLQGIPRTIIAELL